MPSIQSLSRKSSGALRIRPSVVVRAATTLIVALSCVSLMQKTAPLQERNLLEKPLMKAMSIYDQSTPYIAPVQSDRKLGVLVGIFTADMKNDREYRARHRRLFTLWNDPRVCSLADFQKRSVAKRDSCEVIFTFVVGANPRGPPEWIEQDDDDNGKRMENPILLPPSLDSKFTSSDLDKKDVTRLNICENMNEGKSQTWFKYGYLIAQDYPEISYVMKLDADSILHLHEFFHFAYRHLPPPPHSNNAYVGALRDKAYWPLKKGITPKDREELEGFFGADFEGVHLYLAGQCYILSINLARVVMKESKVLDEKKIRLAENPPKIKRNYTSYLEGHEDHDIAAMVFHSLEPVHLITVGRKQRFWEHPVKGEPRWRRIWHREVARMEGRPFENKLYSTESSYEEVTGLQIDVTA
ncbi:expressed unknown protein [Seminavis robusta]|uniref:Hexosyltransferase n=1 Tax=Seminavis robusta TaxID=568900 RepID=A0A9N8DK87_9STRA|nr:expressed unknown protein [Seminavis robusta]|eukprot:Sro104_g052770.1 n/a (412) ;mRNA; r:40946-42285